ncbi:hypothetical protein RSAG8_04687, partial [Rhizoctonia solani AG-8 WAC10335]
MPSLQWARHPESDEVNSVSPKSQRSDLDSSSVMRSKTALRPAGSLQRRPSANTRYMNMLLELDAVPRFHNMLASFFTWVLLAGFVIFPGTFASIQYSCTCQITSGNFRRRVDHPPNFRLTWFLAQVRSMDLRARYPPSSMYSVNKEGGSPLRQS